MNPLTELLRDVRDNVAPNVDSYATRRWFARFNLNIRRAIADGLVIEDPRRRCAYRLTAKGRAVLEGTAARL